jgi:uracil-DNA glycosylase
MQSVLSSIDPSWRRFFEFQFSQPKIKQLFDYLAQQQELGVTIYPPQSLWFRAFDLPVEKIKLTIIGQDPYFNEDQAMGLSFSVPKSQKIPPSLRNIYRELASDLELTAVNHGDLSRWVDEEGIFLLNASLTVEAGNAGSHLKQGWQQFTQAVIEHINQQCQHTVFLAWGAFAHKCCRNIDPQHHQVIMTSHPSPLGAYKVMKTAPAFLGSQCFSLANQYLITHSKQPINWSVD